MLPYTREIFNKSCIGYRCSTESSPKELSTVLRQVTVNECLGENSLHYQSLTHDQLCEEAQKFLEDGHYSGDLGGLVLPALVNVLSLPITIFTSAENMSVVTLLPISSHVINSHPLFLAYSQVIMMLYPTLIKYKTKKMYNHL